MTSIFKIILSITEFTAINNFIILYYKKSMFKNVLYVFIFMYLY